MKISELRPCDYCGQKIGMTFYVVRVSMAIVKPDSARQVLGLTSMLGGSLALAETFAPDADEAVIVVGDKQPALMDEVFICQDCYVLKDIRISQLAEKQFDKKTEGSDEL